jgi:hypothetical protein
VGSKHQKLLAGKRSLSDFISYLSIGDNVFDALHDGGGTDLDFHGPVCRSADREIDFRNGITVGNRTAERAIGHNGNIS